MAPPPGRPLWLRLVLWAALAVGALLLLVVLLVLFVLGTETGGRFLVSNLDRPRTPLAIESFSGRLGSRFELRGIRVDADSLPVSAAVERLAVVWHPLALAGKKLDIDRIEVSGVDIAVREAAPKKKKEPAPADSMPAKIELPIAIDLGELRIERAHLTAKDIAVDLDTLRAGGGLEAYWLRAAARVSAPKIDRAVVTLRAQGASDHAAIESLAVGALDGILDLTGRAAWFPAPAWDVTVAIDHMAPGLLLPDPAAWPGAVSLRAASEGQIRAGEPHAEVTLESLAGTLRGHPLAGTAELALAGKRLDIAAIDLRWGAAGLRFSGRAEETIDLTFAVDAADLGIAIPDAAGAVHVAGRATGTRTAPRLDVELAGDAIAIAGNRIAAVSGHVNADFGGEGSGDIALVARGIEAAGKMVDSLAVTGGGKKGDHELAAHLRSDSLGARLDLGIAGGLADSTWQGELSRLDIDTRDYGIWGLAGPAAVRAAKSEAALEGFCLESRGGVLPGGVPADPATRLCIDGSWSKVAGSAGRIEATALPLALVGPFLPANCKITGAMSGEADLAVAADTRVGGDVALAIVDGELTIALGDTTDTIGFTTKVTARAGAGGVRADLTGDLTRAGAVFGDLAGEAALPALTHLSGLSDTLAPQPLSAQLRVNFADLGPLGMLVPDVDSLAGRVAVTVDAGGDLRKPDIMGQATLSAGKVHIPDAGLELHDIGLTARGGTSGPIDIEGGLRSGAGSLRLTAAATGAAPDSLRATVRIEGERFTVMNTPEIEVMISPDLDAAVAGRQVQVQGEVEIPYTRIELKEIPPSATRPSSDVRFIDAEAAEKEPPLDVTADVRIVLGDSVSFKGFGFFSRFNGSIKVVEKPGQPTSGSGELRVVDGRYKAYGQDLTLGTWGDSLSGEGDPGRISFAGGPIENPGLDMRAFRKAEDGTIAGLHIQGTARAPEILLFSEPAMADADVLSYILLGRKAGEGGGDSDMLANAAVSLGLKGGNTMARSLGSKVGLDEAGIESEGGLDEAALVTGKYLSPKLYVSHGYGLFDQVSTFRARYLVSKKVTVQAETGAGSGGDVLYRLERGGR